MADNIDIAVRESGSAAVERSFDAVAASALRAQTAVTGLQGALGTMGRSTAATNRLTGMGNAASAATAHIASLNAAITALNSTRVTAGLNNLPNQFNRTGAAARGAGDAVGGFFAAFATAAGLGAMVKTLIDAQIAFQEIHYGLVAATGSAEKAKQEFEFVRRTSDELGLSLQSSAKEYTRLAASANAMNVEVKDTQQLYTSLAKASTVLHLSEEKVQFATLALTQMFSKGRIQAEELRRQLGEHIPGIVPRFQKAVMAITKGTDLAGISFDDLMKKGLLNTKQFLPQLVQALEETGRGWEQASKGLNAEINRLKTAWFELKVEMSSGLFADVVTKAVKFLSTNLKELTGLAVGLGTALAIAFSPVVISRFVAIAQQAWTVMAAHPFFLVAAAIAGVTAAIITMRDEIKLGVDETTTLGDLMTAAWRDIKPAISDAADFAVQAFNKIYDTGAGTFDQLLNELNGFENSNMATWLKILRVATQVIDMIASTIRGAFAGITAVVSMHIELWMDYFKGVGQQVQLLMSGDFAGAVDNAQKVFGSFTDIGAKSADAFSSAFQAEVLRQGDQGLTAGLDNWIKEAQAISKARQGKPGGGTGAPPAPPEEADPTNPKGAAKAAKELEKLKKALADVIGQISPAEEAMKKLAQAQEVLNKSVDKGLITQSRADEIMEKLKKKYEDQLDPLGAINRKMQEQTQLYQYFGDELQARQQLLQYTQQLEQKGVDLTKAQTEALLEQIRAQQEANRINGVKNSILNETVNKQRDDITKVQQTGAMKDAGQISSGQAAQVTVGIFGEEQLAGTQAGYDAAYQMHVDYLAKVQEANAVGLLSQQEADALALQSFLNLQSAKLQGLTTFLGSMTVLMQSQNKTAFRIGQAAAIAETTINTYKAATGAYSAMAGIPYVGPFLGAAAAAAAVVAGVANVQKIRAQQPPGFRTGGSMVVGGSGGIDSQRVQFDATPGEVVSINTPAQARALEQADNQSNGSPVVMQTINQNFSSRPDRTTQRQQARDMRKIALKQAQVE